MDWLNHEKKLAFYSSVLLSRLLVVAQRSVIDLSQSYTSSMSYQLFQHLCSKMWHHFRKTNKSQLAHELDIYSPECTVTDCAGCKYVVDGGWLLGKVKWDHLRKRR